MTLELFFKITFFIVFFSFAYVMTAYTKKSKAGKEDTATRVQMHHEHEVPLLLRLRQIFGIPFYLGVLVWTVAPKFMEWFAIPFPVWVRLGWAGAGIVIRLSQRMESQDPQPETRRGLRPRFAPAQSPCAGDRRSLRKNAAPNLSSFSFDAGLGSASDF
jgi:hypothetical protein